MRRSSDFPHSVFGNCQHSLARICEHTIDDRILNLAQKLAALPDRQNCVDLIEDSLRLRRPFDGETFRRECRRQARNCWRILKRSNSFL